MYAGYKFTYGAWLLEPANARQENLFAKLDVPHGYA